jgi:hypothetical protein
VIHYADGFPTGRDFAAFPGAPGLRFAQRGEERKKVKVKRQKAKPAGRLFLVFFENL